MTADYEQVVIGRIYNRKKLTKSEAGAKKGKSKVQNAHSSTTAKQIGNEYGINESTVRRAGKFATEVEKDPERLIQFIVPA